MTVTTDEAAAIAGISPSALRMWVMRGWLNPVRRGAKPLRFWYDDVAQCQREHRPETWRQRHAEAVSAWAVASGQAICDDSRSRTSAP